MIRAMNPTVQPRQALPDRSPYPCKVELICGCMFSGKTEELLRRARATDPDTVVLFKHVRDDRYSSTEIVTHRQDHHRAMAVSTSAAILERMPPEAELVGIDEGHFFDPALPGVCQELARRGCTVVVTALDLDSWGRPFAVIARLCEQADAVLIKRTPCARCGRPADHTQRTTPITGGNLVGGPEAFEPRCLSCWAPPPEDPIE
ncbi:MAG: thymidine kinase [Planctomycetota bacterium]